VTAINDRVLGSTNQRRGRSSKAAVGWRGRTKKAEGARCRVLLSKIEGCKEDSEQVKCSTPEKSQEDVVLRVRG
jgi:hypothetical protein